MPKALVNKGSSKTVTINLVGPTNGRAGSGFSRMFGDRNVVSFVECQKFQETEGYMTQVTFTGENFKFSLFSDEPISLAQMGLSIVDNKMVFTKKSGVQSTTTSKPKPAEMTVVQTEPNTPEDPETKAITDEITKIIAGETKPEEVVAE